MKYLLLGVAALSIHSSLHAIEVGKAEWIERMTTALPTAFCAPARYFRECFDVSATECEETSASATRVCLAKHKNEIPAVLIQSKDGTRLGTMVGQCVGAAYEVVLYAKRISNTKCNDSSNWGQ